jgi:hypothetical protein
VGDGKEHARLRTAGQCSISRSDVLEEVIVWLKFPLKAIILGNGLSWVRECRQLSGTV